MSYKRKDIKDSVNRVNNFIKNNKKNPNWIRVCSDRLSVNEYNKLDDIKDAINRINTFIKNNGVMPNYVNILDIQMNKSEYSILFRGKLNSTSSIKTSDNKTIFVNTPFLLSKNWVKQDYDTSCALNSLQQCFYNLTSLKVAESTMYKLGYTGATGTSHDRIEAIVKWFNTQYNYDLKVSWKNLSDYGSDVKGRWAKIGEQMSREDTAIFAHILYHNGGTTTGSSHNYGHYEVFDKVNLNTMYIRALNSLSGGYLQDRKISVQETYMKGISQPSICIITK